MATWFQSKIRFQQQDEKGNTKTINQAYLFDAVSYTDAEARAYNYFAAELPEFQLIGLTKMKFNEVFFIENNAEIWFKCKVQYIVFDEKTQNEKKVPFMMLLNAHDIKECYGLLVEKLGQVQDYIISDINATKILDVIPYEEPDAEQKEIPSNFKPLSQVVPQIQEPLVSSEDEFMEEVEEEEIEVAEEEVVALAEETESEDLDEENAINAQIEE
jgi:hypothetical protein